MTDDISKVEDRHIAAAFREVIGPDGGRIKNDEICDFIMQRSRELAALESAHPSRGVVDELTADEVRDLWMATDDDEITEIEHLRRFAKRIQAATPKDQPAQGVG